MKEKALTVTQDARQLVEKYRGQNCLVFVKDEDTHTQAMFLPEVVVVHAAPEDYHNISGKFMPKGYQTDRIGEAAGVNFLEENCGTRIEKVDGNDVYVGFAQAKKRMPDGTWKVSSVCEYEFDPKKRAEEDFLRDSKGKYSGEKDRKLAILTYQKFGRARSSSGARFRAIRELTGMPIAFAPGDIKKSMVFCRVAINTDLLLQQPELRESAIQHALGAKTAIYGPDKYAVEHNGNGHTPQIEDKADEGAEPPFEADEQPAGNSEDEEIRFQLAYLKALGSIEHLAAAGKKKIAEEIAQDAHALDTLNGLVEQTETWLKHPDIIKKYVAVDFDAIRDEVSTHA